jgi:hypothetical protein
MAAGAWTMTNTTRTDLLSGAYNVETGSFKCALFLSTSDLGAGETTYAGVTNEHANQGSPGYETGGKAVALSLTGTTTVKCDIDTDPVWTATGGSIVARFACIYETGTGKILCYCLLDATPDDVTATVGNTFTVAANASGVFTLA